jgi:hypothetical protein
MGSSSGFPIAYSRCSWARLCDIKTADKIKVAHYPVMGVFPKCQGAGCQRKSVRAQVIQLDQGLGIPAQFWSVLLTVSVCRATPAES